MEYGLVAVWLVAYGALAAAGLPVATRLFRRLPGRGAGYALPVALVLFTTGAYWVGHLAYGPVAALAGVALLLAVSVGWGLDRDALRDGELALQVSPDRDAVVEVGAVFVAGFLFVVAIRAVDPAVHAIGGEKFLDFGLLKSLARADRLPPEDVWFAGRPVAYYYGGHLVASLLSSLTLTAPRYAYNLALAGFYGMLVAAAYELAGAVAAERGGSRVLSGATGALFVGVASNLVTPTRLALRALPRSLRRTLAPAVANSPAFSTDDLLAGTGRFSYWDASRVIPDTINEFPLFAWLNGDLHAHMMGMPFLLLGAALAFAYYLTPTAETRRRRLLAFVALPILAGLQAVVDTWSFPTLFGLLWLAATFAPADPLSVFPRSLGGAVRRRWPEGTLATEVRRPLAAAAVAAAALVPGTLLASLFFLSAGSGREVALVPASARAGVVGLLLVHGAFVAVFGGYLLDRVRERRLLSMSAALVALAVVAGAASLPALLVVGPLLAVGWVSLRMDRPVGFETVLVVAGAGLVLAVELLYVREQAGPLRLNTLFKTYMQVWVLWGVAAGVALPALVEGLGDRATPSGRHMRAAFAVALVLSTTLYAGFALSDHFSRAGDPTLDATAFIERDHPDEATAIRKIDALEGQPTLLSAPATGRYPGPGGSYPAPPGMYDWNSSPAASMTGVPTVAGWGHEIGYRGTEAYLTRVRHVDDIYTGTPARRVALLERYDVQYIWVGPAERARYGDVSFGSLQGVEVFYETDGGTVTVYRVHRARLSADGDG